LALYGDEWLDSRSGHFTTSGIVPSVSQHMLAKRQVSDADMPAPLSNWECD